jgi:hypothetical protein
MGERFSLKIMATKTTEVTSEAATKAETAPEAGEAYAVLSPLLHDGTTYQPGDYVQLTDKQAAVLGDWVIEEAIA